MRRCVVILPYSDRYPLPFHHRYHNQLQPRDFPTVWKRNNSNPSNRRCNLHNKNNNNNLSNSTVCRIHSLKSRPHHIHSNLSMPLHIHNRHSMLLPIRNSLTHLNILRRADLPTPHHTTVLLINHPSTVILIPLNHLEVRSRSTHIHTQCQWDRVISPAIGP